MRYTDIYSVSLHYQGAGVGDDDVSRATAALLDTLESLGVTPDRACAAYQAQWAEYDDEAPMTGDARAYITARDAANLALTATWASQPTDFTGVDGFSV